MRELLYVADPMCSWCWGFSPVLARLREAYAGRLRFTLVLGGLRAETTQPLNDAMKGYILEHWRHVHARTGQPFDFAFDVPKGFVYNTEPTCRAVASVRALRFEATFPYLAAVQRAFYVDNADTTQAEVLAGLAADSGVDRGAFLKHFDADEARRATRLDFHLARRLGVSGFPSLVLNDRRGFALRSAGYRDFEELAPPLEAWLDPAA